MEFMRAARRLPRAEYPRLIGLVSDAFVHETTTLILADLVDDYSVEQAALLREWPSESLWLWVLNDHGYSRGQKVVRACRGVIRRVARSLCMARRAMKEHPESRPVDSNNVPFTPREYAGTLPNPWLPDDPRNTHTSAPYDFRSFAHCHRLTWNMLARLGVPTDVQLAWGWLYADLRTVLHKAAPHVE